MKPNLEKDLLSSEWIKQKCNHSSVYSQNLYAALCNNRFFYGDEEWTCSWRYAGGIVSEINGNNDYMDFYCSGIATHINGFVAEGCATDEIKLDLMRLGWIIKAYEKT